MKIFHKVFCLKHESIYETKIFLKNYFPIQAKNSCLTDSSSKEPLK